VGLRVTWTIRSGAKWNDGQPFTAHDVVYTFNLMAKYAALGLNALMSANGGPITSVTLSGTNQVVMSFNTNGPPYFYYIADQTPIVPQHILQNIPASQLSQNSWQDLNPVGTGPNTVTNCFEPRCPKAMPQCAAVRAPDLYTIGLSQVRCLLYAGDVSPAPSPEPLAVQQP
jgi:MarR-like DNA-binding transcriptional regulator SgrR of sgrS sRNA